MAQIIKEICVDVIKRNLFQAIIAKQHDNNSRFLKVTLTNEGKPIQVDSSSVVTINARRADNEARPFGGVVNSDGTVTVPLTPWMLELDDVVKCDIGVVDTASRKLTSTSFELEVETAAYDGDGIEEDENYDLLVTLLSDVANAIDECREVTASAPKSVKVTVTQGEDGSYSADKSYTQVSEAYEAGDTVYCEYGGIVLSMTRMLGSHCVFTSVYNGSVYSIVIKAADNSVTLTVTDLSTGGTGASGEDGGYYTPVITQIDENTIKISFTASKEGMAAVEDQTVTLPSGKDGTNGVGITQITITEV